MLLTATQNIFEHGHDKTETSQKPTGPTNAKYISKSTQNEILGCLAEVVSEEILKKVKESEHFSILTHETKDIKNKN